MTLRTALLMAASAALLWTGSCHAVALQDYSDNTKSASDILNEFKPGNVVTANGDDYSLTGGAKQRIQGAVTRVTQLGALLAIAGIVYSGFLMVTAGGDDEKAKNGKTGLIWSAVGFGAMVLAGPMVNAIINMFYSTLG